MAMSRWPLNKTCFWQEAPFFRPLLLFTTGIVCCDQQWVSQYYFVPALCTFVVSGLMVIALGALRKRTALIDVSYIIALGLFFTTLGWCAYATSVAGKQPDKAIAYADTSSLSLVRIKEAPQVRPATTRLLVEVLSVVRPGEVRPTGGDALVYVYRSKDTNTFREGDTLLIPSRWQAIRNSGNPFELDNAALQRRRGIQLQQFLPPDRIMLFAGANAGNMPLLTSIRVWCDRQLKTYIQDSATLGLLQAMLLGDESGFDPELRQAYSETGVVHIVSISGSHVAVLYLVVVGILYWIKGRRGDWAKFIVGLALVWLYVLVAGGPPSALRSALMFTVLSLCTISEREGNPVNTICCAAFALLLYQPAWLFSVGFQLSFCAVLSMMLFYGPIYKLWYWPTKTWVGKRIWQAMSASIAAEILTAPIVVYYFHNFPLLFLFANLLAALLVGICALVGGLAVIALCWIPPLAEAIGFVVTNLVRVFNASIIWMQGLNIESLRHLQVNAAQLVLIYVIIAALALLWLRRWRGGLQIALGAACAFVAMLCYYHYSTLKQERLIVYNNGRTAAADIVRGAYFSMLAGEKTGYNAKASHIGYHAWQEADMAPPHYLTFRDKRVMVLSDSAQNSFRGQLPADVLILARPLPRLRVAEALNAFHPKEVILATRPSAYHLQRWTDSCAAYGISLYNVSERGAYIME